LQSIPLFLELLKCIGNGGAPSANALESAVGPSVREETLHILLSCAARHSNAAAISEIGQLMKAEQGNIVDIMTAKGIILSLKMLPNAYIAGRAELVESLVQRGHVLHPSIPYSVLLTAACQKQTYPCRLLESLLMNEDKAKGLQKCKKEDLYKECIELCCENDRDDLVELFIKRQGQPSEKALEQYSTCLGRVMSRIGSQLYSVRSSQRRIRCVDIDWQNRGLCQVHDNWLSKANLSAFLARFDVSHNQLSFLPSCVFDGTLPWLEEVDCSHNKLKALWSEDDNRPSSDRNRLKTINASYNMLSELPLHLFQIPSLETLIASHNDLSDLPGSDMLLETSGTWSDTDSNEAIENCWLCTRLKHLDVSHNHIRLLPEMFGYTLHLRRLDVAYNNIKAIPRSLSKAHFLEQADLSHNRLGLCPDPSNFSSLPRSIQRLNVSNNELDCIPHDVVSITSLQLLNCAGNLIASLPCKQHWRLPHLKSLILRDNKVTGITAFPDSFSKSLTFLDMSNNRLKKFPEAVFTLKMAETLSFKGNPGVNCLPPAIADLTRLWELNLDDMAKAFRDFTLEETRDSGLHYSKIKSIIKKKFYEYAPYYGIKLAISGSLKSRDCALRALHYQPGQEHSLPAQFPVVTNIVYRTAPSDGSSGSLGVLTQWLPTWLNNYSQTESKEATMKVWNVPDDRSLSVLQHVFFTENTVQLLVWHESDGQPGLDNLEHTLQLIRRSASIRTVLVLLTAAAPPPDIQQRIDKLKQSPELNQTVNVYIRGAKTTPPLIHEIFKLSEELAGVGDNFVERDTNRVPAAFRHAATKMFYPDTCFNRAVCTRQFIQEQIFPDGFSDPDDFVQAMRFLMRIGALIHFEDTPRNLHEYFFTDIDLISRILVALTSGHSPHLSSGVAHARHIYAVLNKMSGSEAAGSALFAFLVKVGVVGPLDCCHCLLPFRLSPERNGLKLTLSHYLSPCNGNLENSAPTYVRRLYSISGLPPSFWGRFINALVLQIQHVLNTLESTDEQKVASNAVFWATGILALYNDGLFVVSAVTQDQSSEYMVPIPYSKRCTDSGLDIVVFDRRRRFVALGLICSHVERLLQEWIDSSGIYIVLTLYTLFDSCQ
jgi:Leucine-rich repeat (LRR) protein